RRRWRRGSSRIFILRQRRGKLQETGKNKLKREPHFSTLQFSYVLRLPRKLLTNRLRKSRLIAILPKSNLTEFTCRLMTQTVGRELTSTLTSDRTGTIAEHSFRR